MSRNRQDSCSCTCPASTLSAALDLWSKGGSVIEPYSRHLCPLEPGIARTAFSHTIIFRIYIPVVSGVKVLFQGVRFICALEGRSVLYPLTPTHKIKKKKGFSTFSSKLICKTCAQQYNCYLKPWRCGCRNRC